MKINQSRHARRTDTNRRKPDPAFGMSTTGFPFDCLHCFSSWNIGWLPLNVAAIVLPGFQMCGIFVTLSSYYRVLAEPVYIPDTGRMLSGGCKSDATCWHRQSIDTKLQSNIVLAICQKSTLAAETSFYIISMWNVLPTDYKILGLFGT